MLCAFSPAINFPFTYIALGKLRAQVSSSISSSVYVRHYSHSLNPAHLGQRAVIGDFQAVFDFKGSMKYRLLATVICKLRVLMEVRSRCTKGFMNVVMIGFARKDLDIYDERMSRLW